jgi:hypothetical protein
MRRALAFVVAAGLIAGSVVLRDRIDERDARKRTVVRLICVTELAAVCEALEESEASSVEAAVEPAATTADRLSRPGAIDLDGWLVTPPWPDVVDGARQRAGLTDLFDDPGPAVARSPLVIVVRRQREATLRASCGGTINWKCVGDAAPKRWDEIEGEPIWGPVRPWHPAAQTEAIGLLVVGQATSGYYAPTPVTAFELDDDGYLAWLTGLERAVRRTNGSVLTMLTAPAQVDIVGTTEADAGPQIASAAVTEKPVVFYPAPVATADVVLAPVAGSRVTRLLRDLVAGAGGRALARNGWRVDGEAPVAGIDLSVVLPAADGLPKPGVLEALRSRLREIR